jgi:hypothetical protein
MINFNHKINKNYGYELVLFNKNRQSHDGLTFFNLNINWDRFLLDHSPKFTFELIILNLEIIEFDIYYLHHRNEIKEIYNAPLQTSLDNIYYDAQRWTAFHNGETVHINIGRLTYEQMLKSNKDEVINLNDLIEVGEFEYGYII